MLVLSRQRGESIVIGDDVTITVVDIRGDKIRLGVTAPKETPVHRHEVYDALQRERTEGPRSPQQLAADELLARAASFDDQAKKLREMAAEVRS